MSWDDEADDDVCLLADWSPRIFLLRSSAPCMSTDIPRIPASTSDLQPINETNPAWLETSLFASTDIQYLYCAAI